MKYARLMLGVGLAALAVVGAGCSTPQSQDLPVLQGAWLGEPVWPTESPARLVLTGNSMELDFLSTNAGPRVGYQGRFTLREDTNPRQLVAVVTNCPLPQWVGKKAKAIYRFENGTVRMTINEPGDPTVPPNFYAPGMAQWIFRR